MANEFFEHGIDRLLQLVQPGMLCAFDFDGTIAPIVEDPAGARIPTPVLRRLAALAEFAPVAIITGRSVEDVSLRLDFFPHFVVGNHGIEGVPGRESREKQYRSTCRAWMRELQRALNEEGSDPAIWVEDKTYSLSVHYRLAKDPAATEERLRALIQGTIPEAKLVSGKCVLNLLPAGAPDKGSALVDLIKQIEAPGAIYVGDDVTDESVFKLAHDRLLTLRVENAPQTAAEFYLRDISGMIPFLDILLKRMSEMLMPVAAMPTATLR